MANWENKTLFVGDNLHVMRGMDSQAVDLIYLDPPFNSNRTYSAPIGSQAAGAAFKDAWTLSDIDLVEHQLLKEEYPDLYAVIDVAGRTHSKGMKSYLLMMAFRLWEMRRLLKDTGSLYLHCDPTASPYLRLALDAIFGRANFRNEIVWHYSGWNKRLKRNLESRHDVILFYAADQNNTFNYPVRAWESEEEYIAKRRQKVHVDENGGRYVLSDAGNGKRAKRYIADAMRYGVPLDNVWAIDKINNSDKERVGYPTQKPLALLDRIIRASSNAGDVILDPSAAALQRL